MTNFNNEELDFNEDENEDEDLDTFWAELEDLEFEAGSALAGNLEDENEDEEEEDA